MGYNPIICFLQNQVLRRRGTTLPLEQGVIKPISLQSAVIHYYTKGIIIIVYNSLSQYNFFPYKIKWH